MVKIAHLTSAHPPFDVRIFEKECRSLARAGYEVCTIAPHGHDAECDGVRIHAVPLPQGRLGRFTKVVWNVYRAALKENAVIYHFHDPDLMPIGWLLKLHGKRVIYDVHEDYRRTILSKAWIPSPIRRLAAGATALAESLSGALFDAVVVAAPAIAGHFPNSKTHVIANFPDWEADGNGIRDDEGPRTRGRIIYVGSNSRERGLETMVEAIAEIREDLSPQLVIAGNFPASLQPLVAGKPGLARTRILGVLRRNEVIELLNSAEVGLCLHHPTPNHLIGYPIKLFEYMAYGLPVVASDIPILRQFIVDSNCGIVVDPADSRAVAEAITWLLEHPQQAREMGNNGRRAVRERYNWDSEMKKLTQLYSSLAGKRRTYAA